MVAAVGRQDNFHYAPDRGAAEHDHESQHSSSRAARGLFTTEQHPCPGDLWSIGGRGNDVKSTEASLPSNLLEYRAKTFSLVGVDHLDEPNPALDVQPELRMSLSVLALRTEPNAVGEYRLESIEVGSHDIHALIGHYARQVLPHALAHDARFPMVRGETL